MEEKKKNRTFTVVIVAAAVLLIAFNAFSYFGTSIMITGNELASVTGKDPASGRNMTLDLSKGVVIVNIWATWCGACLAEMPEINKIAAGHKVYGIIKPTFKMEVYNQVESNFRSVIAPEEFFEELYISVLPTSLLLKDGVIKSVHTGTMTAEYAEEWIKKAEQD